MNTRNFLAITFLSLGLLVCVTPVALSDVSPGDVIDSTNWEKAEGLIPASVLDWVKKGDWVLEISDLNYDIGEYYADFALEAFEKNRGKYGVGPNNEIVHAGTDQAVEPIVGLPFPDIDPNDPKAAVKIMHNNHYMQYIVGDLRADYHLVWVGRSGFEREVGCRWNQAAMDGWPGALPRGNPDRIEKYATLLVLNPFDVAGTAVMLWRYLEPEKLDCTFGYIPAVRRVRRMSPASRSDAYIGSDVCVDDANGYDGKVTAFEWKLLGMRNAIVPWYDEDPIPVLQTDQNEWATSKDIKKIRHGYEKEGWQGAPWAATNLTWTKRPVYILEMKPKDRYYNYGTHTMWVDAQTYSCNYKVICDRSGEYWKTFLKADIPCESANGRVKILTLGTQQVVDDRTEHCTVIEGISPRNSYVYFARVDLNDFTLGGFQKYCK
jgi:hypothetical protein